MVRLIALAVTLLLADKAPPDKLDAFVRNDLNLGRYKAAFVDLDHDGIPEALIYADGPDDCGSGGCDLFVLATSAGGYRLVTKVSVVRSPVRVLPGRSHGWQDLGVSVAGGGIGRGYEARLRFDGISYPGNPTVPPAERLGVIKGRIVLQ